MIRPSAQALTLVIPARAGDASLLDATLARWRPAAIGALAAARSVRHAALFTLPAREGAALAIETAFEGDLSLHLDELWGTLGEALGDLGSVGGIPELSESQRFMCFARARSSRVAAFYAAHGPTLSSARPEPAELARVFALSPLFELDECVRRWFGSRSRSRAERADATGAATCGERSAFAALFPLRPGSLRPSALRRALKLADSVFSAEAARIRELGPGGLAALHTVRFVLLRDRLLVTGLVEGPTAVFFDRLTETPSPLLSAIFMHTEGFPPTRFSVFGGARHHRRFRRWIRAFQIQNGIWYSAYPDLS